MITVYQANWQRLTPEETSDLLMGSEKAVREIWQRGLYREVAVVHTNEAEVAYAHTNTLSGCWSADPKTDPDGQERDVEVDVVDWASEHGCRSTSMGDVILRLGQYEYVAAVGFKPLPDLPDLGSSVEDHRAAAMEAYEKLMKVDWTKLGFSGLHSAIPWRELRAAAGKED